MRHIWTLVRPVPEVVRRVGRKSTSSCAQGIDTLLSVKNLAYKTWGKNRRFRLLRRARRSRWYVNSQKKSLINNPFGHQNFFHDKNSKFSKNHQKTMFKNHSTKSPGDSRLKIGYVTERTVTRVRAKFRDKNSLQSHRTNDFYDRFINSFETQHRLSGRSTCPSPRKKQLACRRHGNDVL